ncbi:uncharacterized protein JCM6883_002366 [Sporobolomyces salmoneus]|uniref:uncharacterized protein n=1 Tax=Sporobolomyces salmoneus TaxID=183962 RepID=UPI003177C3D6
MDQHHSPALDRLIRRQRVGGQGEPSLPNASSDSSTTTPAAAESTTTTSQAPSTTSAAPSTTTTTSQAPVETTSSSLVPASSSSSTTTTPVEESSSSVVSSSSSSSTTTSVAPVTTPSTTSSSTTNERETSTTEEADTAFSTSARTTVVVVAGSATSGTSSGTASLASSTSGSSSSSGVSTGGVIGIVAGAVVGVVFVAALIAFLFKKFSRKNDDDQISPFDKDEFRRASVMLEDDDAYPESYHNNGGGGGMGHSPQMSEYSMSNVGVGVLPGLARGGTMNNPRPPTGIMNHYQQQQQMMPSFQPGQVVPTSSGSPPMSAYGNGQPQFSSHSPPLGGNYAPMDPYAYPQQPQPVQFADQTGGLSLAAAGHWNGIAPPLNHGSPDLSRANSQMSSYSQFSSDGAPRQIVPAALRPGASSQGHPDERPLSLVQEDDEPYSPSHANFSHHQQQHQQRGGSPIDYIPERSGTPTNSNVQQTFFGGAQGVMTAETGNDWEEEEREREQARRLSIRNGGLDRFRDEDPYDGMH